MSKSAKGSPKNAPAHGDMAILERAGVCSSDLAEALTGVPTPGLPELEAVNRHAFERIVKDTQGQSAEGLRAQLQDLGYTGIRVGQDLIDLTSSEIADRLRTGEYKELLDTHEDTIEVVAFVIWASIKAAKAQEKAKAQKERQALRRAMGNQVNPVITKAVKPRRDGRNARKPATAHTRESEQRVIDAFNTGEFYRDGKCADFVIRKWEKELAMGQATLQPNCNIPSKGRLQNLLSDARKQGKLIDRPKREPRQD